jgi:translocation and assembly module TamB
MRTLRCLAVAAAVVFLATTVLLAGLNSGPGRRLAERLLHQASGGQVTLAGLAGVFPGGLRLGRLEIRDSGGVWLSVQDAALDWSPARLLAGELRIVRLTAGRVALARLPAVAAASPAPAGTGTSVPFLRLDLAWLHIGRLELAAPAAGAAAVLSVEGSARLASASAGTARLVLERLDAPGSYRVDGRVGAGAVAVQVRAQEPAGGLAGQMAGLPDLGAIAATATLAGPWSAAALSVAASAGALRAEASGTFDLARQAGALDLSVQAPPMRPRPDLAWQGVALAAHVRGPFAAPEATATFVLDGLEAAGAGLRRLSAQAAGHAGAATLAASAEGLRLPGSRPGLLAAAPLRLTLDAGLNALGRPVRFVLSHPLGVIEGMARTAGALSASAKVTLPDLASLADAAGVDVQGSAALTVTAAGEPAGIRLAVAGMAGITGGMAPLPGLLGPEARIDLSALLLGPDVTLTKLDVAGRALTATAQGGLHGDDIALDWRLGVADLRTVAKTLAGALTAQGHVSGRTGDFAVAADLAGELATPGLPRRPVQASVRAQGLPANPSGTLSAGGTLDGAPLALAAEAARRPDGTLHLDIARADWRGTHAAGALDLPPGATLPLGGMTVTVADLSAFSRLAGQRLTGSIEAALRTEQQDGIPVAVLAITARHAGLPGQAAVDEATLAARVRGPAAPPVTEARLTLAGLRAGGVGGGLRLDARGPPDALALIFSADLTGLDAAQLSARATATLDLPKRSLGLTTLEAGWHGETLRLLAPSRLSFAGGVSVDRVRLGLGEAVLEAAGRVSPTLDLTASLRNVTAGLVRAVAPGLTADGRLEAEATLGGTSAHPTGTLRVAATGLRLDRGEAAGLPPAALTASATLAGDQARLEALLTAGANRLTLAGSVPLAAAETMELRAAGRMDLASFDPILAAGGRRARGHLTLESSLGGTVAAPRADGTLRLEGGELQDFSQGVRLSGIEAVVEASGQSLRIARFAARAGNGTISAAGSIGLAAPMPVALALTLRNASPLASDRLTAALDADLSLGGEAAGRLEAAGKVTIQRGEIRIPERLPADLAVLNLRRPGRMPPPAPAAGPDVGLDISLTAPGRLFVRGRGVEAELSGDLHIRGGTAAPRPDGSFKLRRGQFTLAGTTLDFTRGEAGFDGSGRLDPTLDFLASSSNGSVTANLAITGYASAPKITLSSTPALPQDEVLAWLIFHQSAGSLSPLQLAQIAQALAQISGVGGGFDPLERLRSGLRLDRLSVGGGKGQAVEGGRYVAEGVYVGARQGTSGAGTQAVVQIDLARGLKLQGTAGQNQGTTGATASGQDSGTSVGLTYQVDY